MLNKVTVINSTQDSCQCWLTRESESPMIFYCHITMTEPDLPFSLHISRTGTFSFLKLKNLITTKGLLIVEINQKIISLSLSFIYLFITLIAIKNSFPIIHIAIDMVTFTRKRVGRE